MSALVARDIEVRRGKALAVSGMDLTIESNQWFGLIGANGSGKSTFMQILSGELDPSSGNVSKLQHERVSVLMGFFLSAYKSTE